MRLIDADEIIKETWGVVIKDMFHMDETVEVISRKDIDNAPTVEAIPIDFIKAFGESLLDRRERFVLETLIGVWEGKREIKVPYINQMLDDWEKENETN